MNNTSKKSSMRDESQTIASITRDEFSRLLPQNALHPTHYLYELFHLPQEVASRNGYALNPGSRDFDIFRHAVSRLISLVTVLNNFPIWSSIVLSPDIRNYSNDPTGENILVPSHIRDFLDDDAELSAFHRYRLLAKARNAVKRKPITQEDCIFAMEKIGQVCSILLFLFSVASLPEHGDADEPEDTEETQFMIQRLKIAVYLLPLGEFFDSYEQWDQIAHRMSPGTNGKNGSCCVNGECLV